MTPMRFASSWVWTLRSSRSLTPRRCWIFGTCWRSAIEVRGCSSPGTRSLMSRAGSPSLSSEVPLGDGTRASTGDLIITRRNDRRLHPVRGGWVRNDDRWPTELRGAGLTEDQIGALGTSDSFGPLTAELRRAEEASHGITQVLPRLVAQRSLDDAGDLGAVLIIRLWHTAPRPGRVKPTGARLAICPHVAPGPASAGSTFWPCSSCGTHALL